MPRSARLAALLLLALAPTALAQLPQACTLTTAVNPQGQTHQPGQRLTYDFTASAGNVGGDVTFRVRSVTSGWNATLSRQSAPVAAGGSASVQVLVAAPLNGTSPASVELEATFTCALAPGATLPGSVTGTETLTPTLAAPSAPAEPAPFPSGALLVVGGLGVLGFAGVVALVSRAPVTLRAPEPRRDVPPGGGASFAVELRNRTRGPLAVELQLGELPEGWRVISPPTGARLEGGATQTVQLLVKSPAGAAPGQAAEVEVRARAKGTQRVAHTVLQAFVVGPHGERPDVIVRDEGARKRKR